MLIIITISSLSSKTKIQFSIEFNVKVKQKLNSETKLLLIGKALMICIRNKLLEELRDCTIRN